MLPSCNWNNILTPTRFFWSFPLPLTTTASLGIFYMAIFENTDYTTRTPVLALGDMSITLKSYETLRIGRNHIAHIAGTCTYLWTPWVGCLLVQSSALDSLLSAPARPPYVSFNCVPLIGCPQPAHSHTV